MAATLKCDTIQNASSSTANLTLDASANATVAGTLAMGHSFKRNRIINGDMRVDQRNAGASVTITNTSVATYTIDRWQVFGSAASKFSVQQNAGPVTPPAGFANYLGVTSLAATTPGSGDQYYVGQYIEGYNVSDLAFGSANAKTITLSFWVRSSLTGTFGGSLANSAFNRSYPFTYSISSANTWEQKTVTIAGDTTGTWLTTNGIGLQVNFGIGVGSTLSGTAGSWAAAAYVSATGATSVVGTNGATFYITGVQLEVGSIATPYERQIYSDQLAQCQRYYQQIDSLGWVNLLTGTYNGVWVAWKVSMRASPTVTLYSTNTSTAGKIYYQDGATDVNASASPVTLDGTQVRVNNVSTNVGSNMYCKVTASIEL